MSAVRLPAVYSMYWNNIPDGIKNGQRAVFDRLGIELIQENANRKSHGLWMNEVIGRHGSDDIVVFSDIDAFPVNREAYLQSVKYAADGFLFGLAQFSNHKSNQDLYAGPMFMAFRKRTWESLGRPSLDRDKQYDAAEVFSALARNRGVGLKLVMPSSCLIPKWALAEHGVFGIGTFYGECDFFHLFESRRPAYEMLFDSVVADVVAGRKLNFRHYLEIAACAQNVSEPPKRRNGLMRLLTSLRK